MDKKTLKKLALKHLNWCCENGINNKRFCSELCKVCFVNFIEKQGYKLVKRGENYGK